MTQIMLICRSQNCDCQHYVYNLHPFSYHPQQFCQSHNKTSNTDKNKTIQSRLSICLHFFPFKNIHLTMYVNGPPLRLVENSKQCKIWPGS